MQNFNDDEGYRISRLHELELLDKRRKTSLVHLQAYQNYLKCNYNNVFKVRNFDIGDLVLKEKNQAILSLIGWVLISSTQHMDLVPIN